MISLLHQKKTAAKVAEMGIIMYLFRYLDISLPPRLPQVFPRSGTIDNIRFIEIINPH